MNARPLIILAVILIAIVGAATWFLQTQPTPALPPAMAAPNTTEPRPADSTAQPPLPPTRPAATPRVAQTAPETERPAPQPMAEWELRIDEILRTNVGETESAQMLINLLPTLPEEGKLEASQHIANLILDKDYDRMMPLLRNTNLPEDVHDVFVTDLMNRDDAVKLPALLEIAKLPNHSHQEEAKSDLEIFLDEDYGNDWGKWEAAMKKYLQEQQAEEAAAEAEMTKITE